MQVVNFTGLPLSDVLAMASTQPARYLGLTPRGTVHATWNPATWQFDVSRMTE